jgi:hypothetical protein
MVEPQVISSQQYSAESPHKPLSSEVIMPDTRRCFLRNLAGISSSFLLFQSSPPIPEPRRRIPVDPPLPAEKQDTDNPPDTSRNLKRAQLQAQEKQFRETMARLYTKVTDLKQEVDALHPSQVFSVAIFKQTQEIEKLAKQLKTYAKA